MDMDVDVFDLFYSVKCWANVLMEVISLRLEFSSSLLSSLCI